MHSTSTFLLQSRKRSADTMVAESAKSAKSAKTVNTAKHSLYEKGYHVVPVFHDPRSVWTKLLAEIHSDPYFIDPTQQQVMGGFAALATPHSYHNNTVRELRKALQPVGVQVFGPDVKQCVDRLMYRLPNQRPSAESWHRDESPAAGVVYGGWVNFNDHDEHFICCPGTHQLNGGHGGFATIPKEEHAKWKALETRVAIPPGHMIIFFENIVHRVCRGPKLTRPSIRLFVGWSEQTDEQTEQTQLQTHQRMRAFQTPKIKSGQQPPLYSRQHLACWMERIEAWSVNVKDEFCYNHVVKSGKNKDKVFRIARRFPGVPGAPVPAISYTPYNTEELEMLAF